MKLYMGFLVLALLCMATMARASDLTLFGGAQRQGALTVGSATSGLTSLPAHGFGTFGARLSFGHIIGDETTLAYSPHFLSSQSHGFIYNTNLLVQAPLPVVRPYGTVGVGGVSIGGNLPQALRGTKFALNYGGGVKFKLAGPLGGNFGARGYRVYGLQGKSLNILEVSMGLTFFF